MEKKDKLGGSSIDLVGMNIMLYGKADPDSVDATPEMFELAKPKLTGNWGKAIFVGTSGEASRNGNNSFMNIWDEDGQR